MVNIPVPATNETPPTNALYVVYVPSAIEGQPGRAISMDLPTFTSLVSHGSPSVVTSAAWDADDNELTLTYSQLGTAVDQVIPLASSSAQPELLWDYTVDDLQISGTTATRPYSDVDLFFASGAATTDLKSYELRRAFNPNRMLVFISVRGDDGDLPSVPATAEYENVHRLMPGFLLARSTNTHPAWETYVQPALRAGKYFSNTSNTRITASVSSSNGVHPSNPFRGALQIWEM